MTATPISDQPTLTSGQRRALRVVAHWTLCRISNQTSMEHRRIYWKTAQALADLGYATTGPNTTGEARITAAGVQRAELEGFARQ